MEEKSVNSEQPSLREIVVTGDNSLAEIGSLSRMMNRFLSREVSEHQREENRNKIVDKAEALLAERGMAAPTREIPMSVGLPLMGYASLEEDHELRSTWAKLLANAADASSGVELRSAYVDMLKSLSAFDVKILSMLGKLSYSDLPQENLPLIITYDLPKDAAILTDLYTSQHPDEPHPPAPSETVLLALSNLLRAGCIAGSTGWGGGVYFNQVQITPMGMGLYRACVK